VLFLAILVEKTSKKDFQVEASFVRSAFEIQIRVNSGWVPNATLASVMIKILPAICQQKGSLER